MTTPRPARTVFDTMNARGFHAPALERMPPLLWLSPGTPAQMTDGLLDLLQIAGLPPFHVDGDGCWNVGSAGGADGPGAWSVETTPGGDTTVWCPLLTDPLGTGRRQQLLNTMRLRHVPPGWDDAIQAAGHVILLIGHPTPIGHGPAALTTTLETITRKRTLCGTVPLTRPA